MFVAVVPPATAREHLDAFLEPRRDDPAAAGFRWSDPEQLHVTLAFAGAVPDRALDGLTEALGRAAGRRTAFAAAVGGGGAFPDPAQSRVLYADLALDSDARAELDRLAVGVRAAAGHAGVAVDGQRFRPHVTLARLGRRTEVSRWVRVLDAYRGPSFAVEEVVLVASYLGEGPRRRPRYEEVASFPLAAR